MKDSISFLKGLLSVDDIIVIGCSYGPDSMALVNILMELRDEYNLKLIVAHVNHKVRRESDDEALELLEFCKKNDLVYEAMEIKNYGEDNFHNEARNIRYRFFEDLVNKYGAKYLMTAHHGDDLIETILMRIVRGSTMQGYKGFSSIVDKGTYKIVRPLVFTTKEDIAKYDEKKGIPYAIDKSNFSSKYTRNRYRKEVLPFLKNEDKNVHRKFLKYSEILGAYDDYICSLVDKVKDDVFYGKKICISYFKELDVVLQNRIICMMLEDYYQDDLVLITDVHTELIRKLIYSRKANSSIYLPNDVVVTKAYDFLSVDLVTKQIDHYEIELSDLCDLPNGKRIEKILESDINDNNYCRLSSLDVSLPLHVRTRRPGDKMYVKGLGGSKKLKDIFIDCKIPLKDRDIWPVVVDSNDSVVWLPGLKKSKFDIPKNKKCDIIFRYY